MRTNVSFLKNAICTLALACSIALPISGNALAQGQSKRPDLARQLDKDAAYESRAEMIAAQTKPGVPEAAISKEPGLDVITAATYGFTATTGVLEDMSSGTTTLVPAASDDGNSILTNIGFDFWYDGVRYTQFGANANGFVKMGAVVGTTAFTNSLGSTTEAPKICSYWDDLWVGTNGKVHSKTIGAAPNRKMIVEWQNMTIPRQGAATIGDATFQMWLFESTGAIEFVYGDAMIVNSANSGYSIGLQSGGATNFASVTTTSSTVSYAAANNTQTNAIASGTAYIFTPNVPVAPTALNFTAVTAIGMTLNWTDNATNEVGYAIYQSTDGVNYSFATQTAANATSFAVAGLSPSTPYFFNIYAVTEGGSSSVLSGNQATTPLGSFTSVQSGNWSDPATWGTANPPTPSDNVTVATGHTVVIDSSTAFDLTVQNGATLEFEATIARTLTCGGSVTIDAGGSFATAATGTQTGHILSIAGNLTNNGTLDFSTNGDTAGAGITFTGATSNTFSGSGATTDVRTVTVNKGASNANILELNPSNFTVRGATTDSATANYLTITNGTFKISGTFTAAFRTFPAATYLIPATGGFWLNNPNYTVSATASSTTTGNNGLLRLTQGIYNIGIGAGDRFIGATGAVFTIEGGTLNASGAFAPQGSVTYAQSGGTVNCGVVGNSSSNFGTFELFGTASSFTISNGTINLHNPSTGGTKVDYRNNAASATTNISGGNVVIGATAGGIFNVVGQMPSVSIAAGRTMRVNAATVFMRGTSVMNDGVIDYTGASPRFDFGSQTGAMSYSGSGVFGTAGTPVAGVGVSANSIFLVTLNAPIICNRINLFQGGFVNSNQITLGSAGASTTVVQIGSTGLTTPGGSFDVSPVHNQGTGGQILLYAFETTARSTGVEVNPTRILTSINGVDNPLGVTIDGGDLNLTATAAALVLTNGRLITGANTLTLNSGSATVTRTTGYVDGNFRKTYTANATKTFEVGTANGYSPVVVQSTAATYPTTITAKAIEGQAPYASGVNSLQRYWTLTGPAITGANLTFTYLASDVVGTVANYKFLKNDAGTITILNPTTGPSSTSAAITAVTSLSDWTLGEPSANADLSDLVPSDGMLSPTFDPATISYTASVPNATSSITVTPTKADANASITVEGNPVVSGNPSAPIALAVGSNMISTVVTAQDGTMKTYTIDVTRAAPSFTLTYNAGPNGSISGSSPQMVPAGGDGTPVTAVPDTGYHFVDWSDASTDNPRTDMNVMGDITVTANFAINTYTLTYTAGPNGSISGTSPQMVNHGGDGTAVTAVPDGGFGFVNWSDASTDNPRTDMNVMGDITVTANFAPAASSNADLSNLVPSVGTLNPAFDPATFAYTESVSAGTTSMTVTPTAADANATIEVRVNGGAYAPVVSGSPSGPLALNVGVNSIDTKVTAQDTTTVRIYSINVTRQGNVNVDPGAGTYATLKDAFDAINAGTHTGAITVDIAGDTTETAAASLNASGIGSASYTSVMITPTGTRTVSGAIAGGNPLVNLAGASNVTIDGLNVIGNALTLSNTTVSTTAGTSTVRFINGASNNTVRNCTVLGSSTAALGTATGTVLFHTSTVAGGNSNNTIANNNIGPAGASLPTKGVMGLGSAGANANTGNLIDNNNIFDFFLATTSVSGVQIGTNNNTWTVSNNRIYQTAPRVFTTAASRYSGIAFTSAGNSVTITSNRIGFGAADGTGTTTISGSSNEFRGISLTNSSTTVFSSIQGNVISGINLTTSRASTTTDLSGFTGIQSGSNATDAPANIGDIAGNTIGSLDGSSTIVIATTSTTANTTPIQGILDFNFQSGLSVSNNNIGSITINNGGTGTTVGFRGILIAATTGVTRTVANNTIGGSVAGAITDNLSGNYAMYGMQISAASATATGNLVSNMNGNANGAVVTMSGIIMSAGTLPITVSGNTVHSLQNTVTGGSAGAIYAIDCGFPVAANVVERNLIHSITVNSSLTAYQVYGIIARTLGTGTYRNNMIRLGLDAAGNPITTGFSIVGIRDSAGATSANSYYYNSIYVGGSGVVSASNTYCMLSDVVTNPRNFVDNIFWNARSNASGGIANVALRVGGTTTNPAGLTSDNNILLASGTDGFTGFFNGGLLLTLADWRAATGVDANSIAADPLFVAPNGDAATVDLHLLCGSPAINAGIPVGGITTDFDGDPRSATTPDIGADEVDLVGPAAVSAVSRLIHGGAGSFDVDLPLVGPVGIEPRSGGASGDYQVIVTFATPVNVGGASVTNGTGMVASAMGTGTDTITINLTGVMNAQYLTVTLSCVDDGINLGDVLVPMAFLLGDANATGTVTASDVSLAKSQAGQPLTNGNFRADVVPNGNINASDVAQIKAVTGIDLPPVSPAAANGKH